VTSHVSAREAQLAEHRGQLVDGNGPAIGHEYRVTLVAVLD